jgi:hypothetical protein
MDIKQAIDIIDPLTKGGKRATLGEIRSFGGRDYIKTNDGWKFHGKGTGKKAQSHYMKTAGQSIENHRKQVKENGIKELEEGKIEIHAKNGDNTGSRKNLEQNVKAFPHQNDGTIKLVEILNPEKQRFTAGAHAIMTGDRAEAAEKQGLGKIVGHYDSDHNFIEKKEDNSDFKLKEKQFLKNKKNTDKDRLKLQSMKDAVKKIDEVKDKVKKDSKSDKVEFSSDFEEKLKEKLPKHYRITKNKQGDFLVSDNSRDGDTSFSIAKTILGDGKPYFGVHLNTRKIVSSTSLADPKAAYQTTSAHRVKTKKIQTVDFVDSQDQIWKLIDRHMKKVNK